MNNYRKLRTEDLLCSRQNKTYSVQFKLDAIELYLTTEMSCQEVAKQFGMTNSSIIANWYRIYRENDVDRLSQPKGHLSKMRKK
ncbi:transposase [Carnobacterium maltaromaticum]|uniref:helix-turn-helix domain-containing protein n=1 Tax=Carnobacterium maltaromaticum TaxID=2751 RepID=UPI001071C07B